MSIKNTNLIYQVAWMLPITTVLSNSISFSQESSPKPQTAPIIEELEELDVSVVVGSDRNNFYTVGGGNLAGSYDVITSDELKYERPDDTLELFSKVPGVTLSRYNQGIINTDISIRGFAGDGVTPHAKLLIDGIPSNLHNGFNELDQLFPSGIGGIETYKGTGDARYGLLNIAGNYNVSSRVDEAREIQLTYGSYDAREISGYWGLKTGKLTHNYFLGFRESNGYRDNTDVSKYSFSGRWFYDFDDNTSLGFIARHAGYEGDSPGYLSAEEARTNPRSSADFASEDGGDKTTSHFSLHYNKTLLSGDLKLSSKAYFQNFERERFVRFSEAGSLGNRFDDQDQFGIINTFNWRIDDQWTLKGGLDFEYQDVLEQRFGTVGQSRIRDLNNVTRNRDYTLETFGGFLSLEQNPTDWLRWNVGVRLDKIEGDFTSTDNAGIETDGDIFDFGVIFQPKANLFIATSDTTTIFANAGRSFQHPIGAALFTTTGDVNGRDVSLNDGWELGVKWQATEDISFRLSVWQQFAKDEFVLIDGDTQNVGETERSGIDFSLNYNITDKTTLWGNYSHTFTEITNPGSNDAIRGNDLRSIPEYNYSVGLNHQFSDKLFGRLHVDGQGSYFVNENNQGGRFGGYTLVNLGFDYQLGNGAISFQINNLLDRDYEYVFDFSSDGTNTIHSPGDGRNASISYKSRLHRRPSWSSHANYVSRSHT